MPSPTVKTQYHSTIANHIDEIIQYFKPDISNEDLSALIKNANYFAI
jgi:hypothetical protein